jgi:2-methylisocitrate lyase-like PEP mutase family enzyme
VKHVITTTTTGRTIMSNAAAKTLKGLHVPGTPIVFSNVWDVPSFNAVASLNSDGGSLVKAVATASWAIAATLGLQDEELSQEQNLSAIAKIAPLAQKAGLPLSTDLQDGYGADIADTVKRAVELGASGANIEDSIPSAGFGKGIDGSLYGKDEQVKRLQTALKAAADAGCPDFVLNARCDVFRLEGGPSDEARMDEAIARGKAYLALGATTVFFWGGPRGLHGAEVSRLVKELDGRVAVLRTSRPGGLTTGQVANLGVARISVGPALFLAANEAIKKTAVDILTIE